MKRISRQTKLEKYFETSMWNLRFIVILGVIFSFIGSILFFLFGSQKILDVTRLFFGPEKLEYAYFISTIIGAIDLYLIGMVLLILSFGMYELFISKIDIPRNEDDGHSLLEITSLDELKTKLVNSIIIVLIVSFFQRVINMTYTTPLDMLYFALSIVALAGGVYLLKKKVTSKK